MSLTDDITEKLNNETSGVTWLGDQIVLLDAEKEQWDSAIEVTDRPLVTQIDAVNETLGEVRAAYQDRINVGCRTDLFWRVIDKSTNMGGETSYDVVCTKISVNGYDALGSSGLGTCFAWLPPTGTNSAGIQTFPLEFLRNIKIGVTTDNLHGIKYYNEPYTIDVGDTTVGQFIGTVGSGSTVLTIMSPYSDNLWADFEAGQLITCDKSGVLADQSVVIAGFSSAVTSLSGLTTTVYTSNLGAGVTSVPTILLASQAVGFATGPESDGSWVTFNVLDDPAGITTESDYAIPFESNPFSPQTLGIMNADRIGIGTWVEYTNAGLTSAPQSWRPEYEISGYSDKGIPDVLAPPVSSGTIYYKEGWTVTPLNAEEGDERTLTALTSIFSSLSSCSAEDAAVTAAESARDTAESDFASDVGTFNTKLEAANSLRKERDGLSSRIWMARTQIGASIKEKERLEALQRHVDAQGL
jgi:hypothetical protein